MEAKGVQTLERALDIIELLSIQQEGLGVTDIGARLSLHKSTVHRLLASLGSRGYIEKDNVRSLYRLGLKVVEISSLRLNHLELKTEAVPILRHLAELTDQPVHLAILSGTDAVYIEKIDPQTSLRLYSQIGRRIPVYCSALGKSLVSDFSDAEIDKVIAATEFRKYTPKTLTDPEAMRLSVHETKRRGWSVDDEEHEVGIRCVAAPIRDYTGTIIAALSTAGDIRTMDPARDAETAREVVESAAAVSVRMGWVHA